MIYVKTMLGLGDAFAARPTIAALLRGNLNVALETPWPEVFADLTGSHRFYGFVKPKNLNIRCAKRNVEESKLFEDQNSDRMRDVVPGARPIQLSYSLHKGCKSIPEQIAESAGVLDVVRWEDFFIPPLRVVSVIPEMNESLRRDLLERLKNMRADAVIVQNKADTVISRFNVSPLGVFRVPTIRTEYKNVARNPAPGLVAAAVDEIGGDWIHLNDIGDGELPLHEDMIAQSFDCSPRAEASHGELSLPSMLDLVSRARCVVTPISWMAWAAMAYQVPTLCVWGGYCGAFDIFGPLLTMADAFNVVAPDEACSCYRPDHQCAKGIPVEKVREAALKLKGK